MKTGYYYRVYGISSRLLAIWGHPNLKYVLHGVASAPVIEKSKGDSLLVDY